MMTGQITQLSCQFHVMIDILECQLKTTAPYRFTEGKSATVLNKYYIDYIYFRS